MGGKSSKVIALESAKLTENSNPVNETHNEQQPSTESTDTANPPEQKWAPFRHTTLKEIAAKKRKKKVTFKEKACKKSPVLVNKRSVLAKVNEAVDVSGLDEALEREEVMLPNTPRIPLSERKPTMIPAFFKTLSNGTFLVEGFLKLRDRPLKIEIIADYIWCVHYDYITAWTEDLEPLEWLATGSYRLQHDSLTSIRALAELKSGRIAVAATTGWHVLSKTGAYEKLVAEGEFTDVVTHDVTVFVALHGWSARARVHVYDESMPWVLIRTVTLPLDGLFTIHISDKTMFACSAKHGCVFTSDLFGQNSTKVAGKGIYGGLGQFHEPRICQRAADGSVLIVDIKNKYLQVRTANGDWGVIHLEEKLSAPLSAVFHNKHLYVVQGNEPYKIIRYK